MAHTTSAQSGLVFRPDLLLIIVLAGVVGFALGQNWSIPDPTTTNTAIPHENWHGNVKSSHWLQ